MRNKYPGICYSCNEQVPKGEGHPERYKGKWRLHCSNCVNRKRAERRADMEVCHCIGRYCKC